MWKAVIKLVDCQQVAVSFVYRIPWHCCICAAGDDMFCAHREWLIVYDWSILTPLLSHVCSQVVSGLNVSVWADSLPVEVLRLDGRLHDGSVWTVARAGQQVVKVIWQKGRIATAHGRFSCFCQVAPMCTPSNTFFLGPTRVHNPKGVSIASAVFAGYTIMTDRQATLLHL